MAAGALSAAAIAGLAPWLARLLAEPAAAPVLAALSATVVIGAFGCVPEALLRRALRFRALAGVDLLALVLGYGAVAIALARTGFGVWALVWGMLARHALFAAAATVASGGLPLRVPPGRREAGELLVTATGFACGSLFSLLGGQAAHLGIGRWLGAAALGHYTRASRLASLRGVAGDVLVRVLFPAMARRQHRAARLGQIWLHGTEIMSLLALPLAVLLAVAAPEIVAVVLGAQWQAAVPVLQVFALAAPWRFCDTLNRPPTRALGAAWRLAWRHAAGAALLVLGVWTGSRWGLAGAAAGAALAQAAAYLLMSQARARSARGALGAPGALPPPGAVGRGVGGAGAGAGRGAGARGGTARGRGTRRQDPGLRRGGFARAVVRAGIRAPGVSALGARAPALRRHGPARARVAVGAGGAGRPARPVTGS